MLTPSPHEDLPARFSAYEARFGLGIPAPSNTAKTSQDAREAPQSVFNAEVGYTTTGFGEAW